MVFLTITVPVLLMPPPLQLAGQKVKLPDSVLLVTLSAPLKFVMPPPEERLELPESVLLVTFSLPVLLLEMPPPSPLEKPDVPLAIVRPESVTSKLPDAILNTRTALLPLTVN